MQDPWQKPKLTANLGHKRRFDQLVTLSHCLQALEQCLQCRDTRQLLHKPLKSAAQAQICPPLRAWVLAQPIAAQNSHQLMKVDK
jgi:hypothetical protein